MNLQSICLSVILVLTSGVVFSHEGGHGEASQEDIISIATEHVTALALEGVDVTGIGKLDQSWTTVPKANKKFTKNKGAYVVTFKHPKEDRTLYLLLSPSGDLYDVNYTGQFKK